MAQNYTKNSYQGSHIGNIDLISMENNFECLRSIFSGSSSPPNPVPAMPWFHTTNKILKMRDKNNSTWIGIMTGDENQKVWCYANSAIDGWIIDSAAPTDCVLAIKGGSNDYDVAGATISGSWQLEDFTLLTSHLPSHIHGSAGNHTHNVNNSGAGSGGVYGMVWAATASVIKTSSNGNHIHGSIGGDTSHNHGDTYRPRAAVGILVHINI